MHKLHRLWARAVKALPLVGWVSYPPLLLSLGGVLLVVAGFGRRLGIPSLVWNDSLPTQLTAGFAVAALCVHLGMIGYLLDSEEVTENGDDGDDGDDGAHEATLSEIAKYVAWPCGALVACALLGLSRPNEVRWHGVCVLLGPVLAAALVLIVVLRDSDRKAAEVLPRQVRARVKTFVRRRHQRSPWARKRHVDHGAHAVHGAAMLVYAVLFVVACVLAQLLPAAVPAAVAVVLALALATGIWGLFAFWMQRYRLIGVGALVLLAFVLGVTKDVRPRGLVSVQLNCDPVPPSPLIDDEAALASWKNRLGEAAPPLVVVVTSGGASRAAAWTITVLDELERRIPGFTRHVRIITGASGGMVGAAHYVSAIEETGLALPARTIRAGAAADSLTAIARALILVGLERGSALETAWERNSDGRLARPFVDLRVGERDGWRPSLVFTPVMVEDGRRLIISNVDLSSLTTSAGPMLRCAGGDLCGQSRSAVQLYACPGEGLDKLRLSTVARMNATFPWVTSAALLPSIPPRRVVDAGYYDNYGVDVASAWIVKNARWLKDNTSGVALVQIRDGQLEAGHWNVAIPGGPGYFHEWISALTTPIEGFLNTQDSSMSFRNDSEISMLATHPLLSKPDHFFVTTTFEFKGDAPLNWYLSAAAIDRLARGPTDDDLKPLNVWWAERTR